MYLGSYVRTFEGREKWQRRLYGQSSRQQWYLRHNGPEHILAFMPTRSGKGVGLILPTLLSWSESSVVFDIKGENWALTSGYLKSRGHVCLRFDPADATGASVRYNPLEEVRLPGMPGDAARRRRQAGHTGSLDRFRISVPGLRATVALRNKRPGAVLGLLQ